jgi:hypothetical protein
MVRHHLSVFAFQHLGPLYLAHLLKPTWPWMQFRLPRSVGAGETLYCLPTAPACAVRFFLLLSWGLHAAAAHHMIQRKRAAAKELSRTESWTLAALLPGLIQLRTAAVVLPCTMIQAKSNAVIRLVQALPVSRAVIQPNHTIPLRVMFKDHKKTRKNKQENKIKIHSTSYTYMSF